MATVEVELRAYKKSNGTQPLVLRITSGNKVSRKNTGLYIQKSEWDSKKRRVNRKHPEWTRINDALDALCKEAEGLKADAIRERSEISPSTIIDQIFSTHDFFEAAELYGSKLDKFNSAKSYTAIATILKQFLLHAQGKQPTKENMLQFNAKLAGEDINAQWLEKFKAWRVSQGKSHNTIVSNLGKIRAVLESMNLKSKSPFSKNVTVGTFKRAKSPEITMEDIQKIRTYTPFHKWDALAKDTFLFSFYAAGMRSSDVLQLKRSDITNTRINFDPNKTADSSQMSLSIPLNEVTKEIISRYTDKTETLFNLVTMFGDGKEAVMERGRIQSMINDGLKTIALNTGIGKPLKFKDARTAFARIANQASQRNVYGIQQAMGHSKITTTEIYLGSDTSAIDELLSVVYK